MIRSPFHFDSYEPRFAIEDRDIESLDHAVALWQRLTFKPGPVTHVVSYPSALIMTGESHPWSSLPWQPVTIALGDVVAYVATWLNTATVDEPRPNFDGTEEKGFCAFCGYFLGKELSGGYGCLIVTTKWIEVHK